MYGLLFNLLTVVAIVIIGVVTAPKAGPAKGRMWLGLGLLLAGSLVGLVWQALLVLPAFFRSVYDSAGVIGFGAINTVIAVITGGLFVAGVAVLASAITLTNQVGGYLDPTRPGAPPISGHQGAGHPPAGSTQTPGPTPYA
ncbi:hypothetical protein [Pseudactinotalea suaedae]|jgi:hypothetical protein|uniref:hypothetical protein n=1 Tax=Pseudactinotalea suaedae TaxID=1524924 RepID=UPI0012E0EDB5|nr:hypothetical protein [Pseudactinotalea suaedae]